MLGASSWAASLIGIRRGLPTRRAGVDCGSFGAEDFLYWRTGVSARSAGNDFRWYRRLAGGDAAVPPGECAELSTFIVEDWASRAWSGLLPLVFPRVPLAEYDFRAPRVCRWAEGGCRSRGSWFVLPDFLMPSCVNEDGPSAIAFFHGGDSTFRRAFGVPSPTRRLLLGGPPSPPSSLACPFVCCKLSSVGGGSR